jgi:ketosteroid isomerase-like protein
MSVNHREYDRLILNMIFFSTKNAILSTALISVVIVTIAPVSAEINSKIQPVIQTNYDRINAAFVRKDIKAATALFTTDYVSISPEGEKQTLSEFQEHYDNLFNRFNIKLTSNQTTIKNIDVKPSGVDVAIEQKTEGTVAGFNKIVINQTSRNLWLKTPQGWRLKQSKILTSQTTFNGKTFKG